MLDAAAAFLGPDVAEALGAADTIQTDFSVSDHGGPREHFRPGSSIEAPGQHGGGSRAPEQGIRLELDKKKRLRLARPEPQPQAKGVVSSHETKPENAGYHPPFPLILRPFYH